MHAVDRQLGVDVGTAAARAGAAGAAAAGSESEESPIREIAASKATGTGTGTGTGTPVVSLSELSTLAGRFTPNFQAQCVVYIQMELCRDDTVAHWLAKRRCDAPDMVCVFYKDLCCWFLK